MTNMPKFFKKCLSCGCVRIHPHSYQKGEVSEWPKEHGWKPCVAQATEGSNPSFSAVFYHLKATVMSYQVIARKWRPQDFDGVVYQDHVSTTIKNSIRNGRISHAYLFSGPRGVGKTTMARVLAKALNCVNGPTDSPCGVCENCREIREGIAFDVLEIDGASNSGVNNIRELRENVNSAPLKSHYKVYIIDEVHMLSKEAFNALLKTLEEPPAHVVFVFATTEYHKIPETILSRCQKYFFKRISIESIVAHLGHIVKQESFRIRDEALYSIARAADGSMRDAQSLLDQVVSFSEGEVSEDDALSILGVVPLASYITLMECIAAGNRAGAIEEINRVVTLGIDIPRYLAGFMDALRSVRLVKNGIVIQDLLGFSKDETAALKAIADKFNDGDLGAVFRIGLAVQADLRFAGNERVVLEMALLDMIAAKAAPSIASILKIIEDSAGGASRPPAEKKTPEIIPSHSTGETKREEAQSPPPEAKASAKGQAGTPVLSPDEIASHWSRMIELIRKEKSYLYFKLEQSVIEYIDGTLTIKFPSGDENSFYNRILDRKDLSFIKDELSKRTGRDIQVKVGEPVHRAAGPEPAEEEDIPPPEAPMLSGPGPDEIEVVNPVVEKVRDVFHGKIIKKGEE